MPSSWNKGTLVDSSMSKVDVAVESASKNFQESSSLFMSVVNDAASSMQQGGKAVSEAAESVYDFIPEATDVIDTAKNLSEDVMEGVEKASKEAAGIAFSNKESKEQKLNPDLPVLEGGGLIPSPETLSTVAVPVLDFFSPVLPVNASKFAEFMNNNGQISLTVNDFAPADINVIKSAAKKVLDEGRSSFTYEDWGFEEKSVLMKDITTMATGTVTSPEFRMATLIGQTAKGNVFLNEQGELIVRDVYDFNTGPLGTKLQQASAHKEAGNMDKYRELSTEVLTDENGDPRPYLQRLRIWAAALGVPEGQGTTWEINLGKLD